MAVVLFAAMWENDGQPEDSEHWLVRRAAAQTDVVAHRDSTSTNHETDVAATDMQPVSRSQSLPEDIAPGDYVVADTRGQTHRIRVTRSMTTSTPVERDHYTLDDNGVTLYFIRVRTEATIAESPKSDRHNG